MGRRHRRAPEGALQLHASPPRSSCASSATAASSTCPSTSGIIGNAGQANYGAAKSGIAGFTRVVAKDLGRYGVTCNAIAPGAATRLTATVPQASRDLRARAGITGAASNRPPTPAAFTLREPEYVAPMAAYLASDDAWNINGQIFHVAGGTVGLAWQPTPMRTIWKPDMWTLDELCEIVPSQLMAGVAQPGAAARRPRGRGAAEAKRGPERWASLKDA